MHPGHPHHLQIYSHLCHVLQLTCVHFGLQVNAALDEVAGFAESTHKSMTAVARNQLGRMGAEDRQRLHGMYHGFGVSADGWHPS